MGLDTLSFLVFMFFMVLVPSGLWDFKFPLFMLSFPLMSFCFPSPTKDYGLLSKLKTLMGNHWAYDFNIMKAFGLGQQHILYLYW